MKKLQIGKPNTLELEDKTRLQAAITTKEFSHIFYYEVEKKWGQYLCYERADAFVLSLLYFALVHGYDIECEAPISEKLYMQLSEIYIPTVVKNDPELFHRINITAPIESKPINSEKGVGASVSGGIDSFYSILKNYKSETKNYNVTHLLLTNCFNIYHGEENTRDRYKVIVEKGTKIANELGLQFVGIYTNEYQFWYPHFVDLYCLRYCALAYAIQKLISVYHYSTGYQFSDFTFKAENRDASHYDFFTVHLISSENMTIYSSGGEANRIEKADYIADNKVVQNNLQVCNTLVDHNCCVCEKCLRTQLNLYACNKLDKYGKVFDLEMFTKNRDKAITECYERHGSFDIEIIEMMKKNRIIIPLIARIKGSVVYVLKSTAKRIKPINDIHIKNKLKKLKNDDRFNYNMNMEYAKKISPDLVWK